MKVANPIYDTVFKYLMEDTEIARRFLSKIIDQEIVKIEIRPQEHTSKSKKHGITILRFDFKATIRLKEPIPTNEKGWQAKYKTVLIELQKSKKAKDIERFRRYLGDSYLKKDAFTDENGEVKTEALPIVTVYILGFPMPPIETSVLKINRVYTDLNTNKVLEVQTEFIEKLTHDSYAILIDRLPEKSRSELERILQVFNQAYILDADNKFLEIRKELQKKNELLQLMIERLRDAATDEEVLMGIIIEQEFEEELDQHIREKEELMEKNDDLKGENNELKIQLEALKKQLKGKK